MAGWLLERGIESPEHRGTFYGCWNAMGILEGVALIGRDTMFEARSDAALYAFAELARRNESLRLLFAEASALERFWQTYRREGQEPRLICHEWLYEKEAETFTALETISSLRKACADELQQVASAHAQLVMEETGENPLDKDSAGFYGRCAARIGQGKIWVLMENDELLFKADVVAETPQVVYIEGLWVKPSHRRKGYGQSCWESLGRVLLAPKQSFCGFVNDGNASARAFYEKVGCRLRARFDKIFI